MVWWFFFIFFPKAPFLVTSYIPLSWNKEMHILKSNFLSSQMDSHSFSHSSLPLYKAKWQTIVGYKKFFSLYYFRASITFTRFFYISFAMIPNQIRVFFLVLLNLYRMSISPKLIWMGPICFGWIQINLDRFKVDFTIR